MTRARTHEANLRKQIVRARTIYMLQVAPIAPVLEVPVLEVAPVAPVPVVAEAIPEPMPVYVTGTKLIWKHNDDVCVAVVTKKDILQVYDRYNTNYQTVDMGQMFASRIVSMSKVSYTSVQAWRESLPEYGVITASYTPSIRDYNKSKPIIATTDYGILKEIEANWKVMSYGMIRDSPEECLSALYTVIHANLRTMDALVPGPNYNVLRRNIIALIRNNSKRYDIMMHRMRDMTYDERNKKPTALFNFHKTYVMAQINGVYTRITTEYHVTRNNYIITKDAYGTTFADLGVEIKENGKPDLVVTWRGKTVVLEY